MALTEESRLTIKIAAEDLTGPAFNSAETKMGKFKTAVGKAAGALTGVGTATLVGALADAARAAADDEASMLKLQQAVENSGASFVDNSAIIRDRIKAGQALAFTDQQIRESLALLTAQTDDLDEALKRQRLAMDLSRGANIDLQTASKLLGRVTEENVNVLGRYGITVAKGASETELFAAIQAKFGGQAEVYGNTTSAAIFKVKDSIDEWKEAVGASLGPAQGLLALLPGMSVGLSAAGGAAGAAGSALHALTGVTLAAAAPFIATAAAVALVGVALWQVKETVELVQANWDKFVYALKSGQLNDIPIFGFFFSKAQQLLGFIDGIRQAWERVTSMIGGGSPGSNSGGNPGENSGGNNNVITPFADGGIVTRPTLAMIGEAGPEAVVPLSRGGVGATYITVNVAGSVVTEKELVGTLGDVLMRQLFAQRNFSF